MAVVNPSATGGSGVGSLLRQRDEEREGQATASRPGSQISSPLRELVRTSLLGDVPQGTSRIARLAPSIGSMNPAVDPASGMGGNQVVGPVEMPNVVSPGADPGIPSISAPMASPSINRPSAAPQAPAVPMPRVQGATAAPRAAAPAINKAGSTGRAPAPRFPNTQLRPAPSRVGSYSVPGTTSSGGGNIFSSASGAVAAAGKNLASKASQIGSRLLPALEGSSLAQLGKGLGNLVGASTIPLSKERIQSGMTRKTKS